MENKINIAELLKDCPKGMALDCTMYDNLYFDSLNADYYGTINCYTLIDGIKTSINFTKYGTFNNYPGAKCVIFPKGKTTWKGFIPPCKFKDGDVIFVTNNESSENFHYKYIAIFKEIKRNKDIYVYGLYSYNEDAFSLHPYLCEITNSTIIKLATEEEKTKLFKAIKDNGYHWNPETKTLEKLPKFKVGDIIQDKDNYKVRITDVNIEDECYGYESLTIHGIGGISFNREDNWELVPNKFDITNLKPFDKVLVRGNVGQKWIIDFFGFMDNDKGLPFVCVGHYVIQCIPYEGNEHLLGTTNNCDNFYKTWE